MLPYAADAEADECTCQDTKAGSLVQAAQKGCLKCCKKCIEEAGRIVQGTTALIQATKNGNLLIVQLLFPAEGYLKDENGQTALYHAAVCGREMLDEVLKILVPGFYVVIRGMREMPCICSTHSDTINKCVENRCMKCTSLLIFQAHQYIDQAVNVVRKVENHRIAPIKLMTFLQEKLDASNAETELIFAIQNNLYEAVATLVDEQRDMHDAKGWKASGYAASVCNPRIWALFPEDIDYQYAADLYKAHSTKCICRRQSWGLLDAVSNHCLQCCARFIYQAERADSTQQEIQNAITIKSDKIVRLLRHVQTGFFWKEGTTALMYAVKNGTMESVRLLTGREAGLQNKNGVTALMIATRRNIRQISQYLTPLEARMQDAFGRTALMYAIKRKCNLLAAMLLPYEGDIKDYEGRGLEEYASNVNDPAFWRHFGLNSVSKKSQQKQSKYQSASTCRLKCRSLVIAARAGCVDCCKIFIDEARVKVNGRTALMEAAVKGHTDVVRLLANPEAGMQDSFGNTALILAAQKGHQDVVKLLIPREAGMVSTVNSTALIQAVKNFHGNCVSLLRQSPDELWASGIQRVMFAAYDGDLQAVLQNRQQWGSLFESGLNVLNFALLRGRRSYIRAITRDHESRQQLASGVILPQSSGVSLLEMMVHFIVKQQHLRQILDVVCTAHQENRSVIATMALFSFYSDWSAMIWRPFCTPRIRDLRYVLGRVSDKFRIIRGFRKLKNVGVLQNIAPTGRKDYNALSCVKNYIIHNPIRLKQSRLARQQANKEVPEERAFAWRETEAEASFNRAILFSARDAICVAFSKARSGPVHPIANRCVAKLERNATMICGAYFYAFGGL